MTDQTMTRQPPPIAELATETVDAQPDRDAAVHREPARSRSTARSRPTTLPTPSSRRPRGHVIGHGLDEPPPPSLDGRPRGHVVGHGLG
jgi:hypothetical protein